jgi:hypothetical protein
VNLSGKTRSYFGKDLLFSGRSKVRREGLFGVICVNGLLREDRKKE